ncbi:MAG: 7-cyano-7-deazaguanine synthase [Chloroflexi bacterium]|nr:7-cyano-7-deazaguanine synthase [Chloroflexota bacterium]
MDVWLLMSGGIDSTASAHYFAQRGDAVQGIFVDYGQAAVCREREAANAVADYLSIPIAELRFQSPQRFATGEIVGRNAFLIFSAMMGMNLKQGILSMGIHAGTQYYDCGSDFIKRVGVLIDNYSVGQLTLHCPFQNNNKDFVYAYALSECIPLHLTYSCELGTVPPCGQCLSCKDRYALTIS